MRNLLVVFVLVISLSLFANINQTFEYRDSWGEHGFSLDAQSSSGVLVNHSIQRFILEEKNINREMLQTIKADVIGLLSKMAVQAPPTLEQEPPQTDFQFKHEEFKGFTGDEQAAEAEAEEPKPARPYVRPERKIGRNEPCPCGSGKKYKQCHGKLQ